MYRVNKKIHGIFLYTDTSYQNYRDEKIIKTASVIEHNHVSLVLYPVLSFVSVHFDNSILPYTYAGLTGIATATYENFMSSVVCCAPFASN